jgi:uncharacterized damage-inducible protein DinB
VPIVDALLPEFDQEMANTRKVLDRLADDRLDFKPHPKSWTMRDLATHLVTIPDWLKDTIEKDDFDYAPPGAPPYQPPRFESKAAIIKHFDEAIANARASLAGASDEKMMANWSLLGGGQVIFTMPRSTIVRSFVMNHLIHHRAQLGIYLRLNDIPVPAMYGPTADES